MRLRTFFALCVLAGLLTGCGSLPPPRSVPPKGSVADSGISGHEMVGIASWYGGKFNGRRTANGEIYDMHILTAAHKTLPFHTIVRVTRLDNGRSVLVRINDRGPFVAGRIIDLSYAAARRLGLDHEGTTRVRLKLLSNRKADLAAPSEGVRIQVGAFSDPRNAAARSRELKELFGQVFVVESDNGLHRVLSTSMKRKDAESLCRRLRDRGIEAFLRVMP